MKGETMKRFGKWLLVVALVSPVWVSGASRPNVFFCMADDASMNTFGAYGGTMEFL
jgi:hypothetical protein